MMSIRRKILVPLLSLIVAIPVITMLLFNFATRLYVRTAAATELENTVKTMNSLIKKELLLNSMESEDGEGVSQVLSGIRLAMKASDLALNTEVIVLGKRDNVLYPREGDDSLLAEDTLQRIVRKVSGSEKNTVQTIGVGGERFLVLKENLSRVNASGQGRILFVSSLNTLDNLLRTLNLFLLIILLAFSGMGALVVMALSRNISGPMHALCEVADRIGHGDFAANAGAGKKKSGILELAQLEGSISRMSKRLSAYDSSQKTFLQNASHELRTPLMSIQGYSEGIEKGILPDAQKAAGIINNESKRLNALVDQLLTLSRMENLTYADEPEKLNLNELLAEYCQRLEGAAMKEGKQLKLRLPDRPVRIMANEELLGHAVMNISTNCIRYARSAVTIELTEGGGPSAGGGPSTGDGPSAVITIADDGEGIAKEDLPRIFERFYRGKKGNTGLGLAIARSAVSLIGGEIKAGNGPAGAVFEIRLNKTVI